MYNYGEMWRLTWMFWNKSDKAELGLPRNNEGGKSSPLLSPASSDRILKTKYLFNFIILVFIGKSEIRNFFY